MINDDKLVCNCRGNARYNTPSCTPCYTAYYTPHYTLYLPPPLTIPALYNIFSGHIYWTPSHKLTNPPSLSFKNTHTNAYRTESMDISNGLNKEFNSREGHDSENPYAPNDNADHQYQHQQQHHYHATATNNTSSPSRNSTYSPGSSPSPGFNPGPSPNLLATSASTGVCMRLKYLGTSQ